MHPLRLAIGRASFVSNEGQIDPKELPCPGLWMDDTRFLSRFQLLLDDKPVTASPVYNDEGFAADVEYMTDNSAVSMKGQWVLHSDGLLYCGLSLQNNSTADVTIRLDVLVAADFLDLFQAKRYVLDQLGQAEIPVVDENFLTMGFFWKDGVCKKTTIAFSECPSPTSIDAQGAQYSLLLEAGEVTTVEIVIQGDAPMKVGSEAMDTSLGVPTPQSRMVALTQSRARQNHWQSAGADIETSNATVNRVIRRANLDLFMLGLPTPYGDFTTAGIPYFRVPFGRDSAISGIQTGSLRPTTVRAILGYLASQQGVKRDEYTGEEPGKIIHELRLGPLARMGLIPHKPCYYSIDSTPLWLMLLLQHLNWSGDIAFARSLQSTVESAVSYLLRSLGEGNGYMRYQKSHPEDYANQSWKDSPDSMRFADGTLATAPVACCEVQAYCYAALCGVAEWADAFGLSADMQEAVRIVAVELQQRFNQDFWMPGVGFLALALDANNRQVDSITSNPGHVLSTGILGPERAKRVAQRLMSDDMFSGWGIRTMSCLMSGYSPTSYHCGTVWPHDTAMAAAGFCQVGEFALAHRLMLALLDAATARDDKRLPELFSGSPRQEGEIPAKSEEEACYPQAWSAGALLQMLIACLGIEADALAGHFHLQPHLPDWLSEVKLSRLHFAGGELDLRFTTNGGRTAYEVLRNTTGITLG